jgi:transcriptional regulator with XRE-family HTH domain
MRSRIAWRRNPLSEARSDRQVSADTDHRPVDPIRVGRQMRALRLRKELRQDDVAARARLSRPVVSRIERGLLESVPIGSLVSAAAAVGAIVDIRLRWNGESLDRLLDEAHARLVEIVVLLLRASGWDVEVEVSFSIWGERGSIDILAYHRATGIVLVVEVKSVVPDSQAALHGLDRKARHARKLAEERGWQCRGVARLLVIGASATARRRIRALDATYRAALPLRGADVRQWIREPRGSIAGLLFVAHDRDGSTRSSVASRQRVTRSRDARKAARF